VFIRQGENQVFDKDRRALIHIVIRTKLINPFIGYCPMQFSSDIDNVWDVKELGTAKDVRV
jgi:hypothetical protein